MNFIWHLSILERHWYFNNMVSLLKLCIILLTQQNSKQNWFQEERGMWITKYSTASEHDVYCSQEAGYKLVRYTLKELVLRIKLSPLLGIPLHRVVIQIAANIQSFFPIHMPTLTLYPNPSNMALTYLTGRTHLPTMYVAQSNNASPIR